VSILIVIALAASYDLLHHRTVMIEGRPLSSARVFLHLGYLTAFFGREWLNPSYWTLAIEFQYYLALGLVFPLLFGKTVWKNRVAFAVVGALALFGDRTLSPVEGAPGGDTVVRFIPLFLAGLAVCQYRLGRLGRVEAGMRIAASLVLALVTTGPLSAFAASLSVLVLLGIRRQWTLTDFLGRISYSLYLTHWPIGHVALSVLGLKLGAQSDTARTFVILVSLAICLVAAWILNVLVERPAQRWASRVTYGHARVPAAIIEASGFARQ
jgi:peptidoglycan/LPS O-acetylase OafA/YrhL